MKFFVCFPPRTDERGQNLLLLFSSGCNCYLFQQRTQIIERHLGSYFSRRNSRHFHRELCHSPATAILNFRARRTLGRGQTRNESRDVLVEPCRFVALENFLAGLAKSSPKSIPKKSPSTLEQAFLMTGKNRVLLGSFIFPFCICISGGVLWC